MSAHTTGPLAVEPDSIQAVDLKADGTPRRYTWNWSTGRLTETQRGLWVRYADHAASLAAPSQASAPDLHAIVSRLASLVDGLNNGNSAAEIEACRLAEQARALLSTATKEAV